jgi:hypothetical protein
VWLLCGADTAACPPGSTAGAILPQAGFQSAAFQHFTSIQVDQSGNIWLSINWSTLNRRPVASESRRSSARPRRYAPR